MFTTLIWLVTFPTLSVHLDDVTLLDDATFIWLVTFPTLSVHLDDVTLLDDATFIWLVTFPTLSVHLDDVTLLDDATLIWSVTFPIVSVHLERRHLQQAPGTGSQPLHLAVSCGARLCTRILSTTLDSVMPPTGGTYPCDYPVRCAFSTVDSAVLGLAS
jgi:uncharacterized membrane protein